MRTKRGLLILVALVGVALLVNAQRRGGDQYPMVPRSDLEKKILATLDAATKAGALYANVPAADGRLLRLLAESVNAKHVVEIGTSTGLSGLWFAMALEKTGGKLTTFEYDAARAATAKKHFAQAGVAGRIEVVEGDAHQTVSRLKEPVDVVFIDADKDGYIDYLNKLLPLVRPGGLILAHNTDMVPAYIKAVTSNADLETVFYLQGGGMAVTLKKR
ncbi:MAG: class I SAM-dependent methyltransferase [Bryobacterales bacterium]|nr:class I SAM-dependent methyltransferase [Bryobacterales bacterium]